MVLGRGPLGGCRVRNEKRKMRIKRKGFAMVVGV